ncbi:hypothetical protein HMI55_001404 [Coelomomyces lativittatus]|nr:hypothetical protein HMI55_001404 [Coelomomyces lativittatus]
MSSKIVPQLLTPPLASSSSSSKTKHYTPSSSNSLQEVPSFFENENENENDDEVGESIPLTSISSFQKNHLLPPSPTSPAFPSSFSSNQLKLTQQHLLNTHQPSSLDFKSSDSYLKEIRKKKEENHIVECSISIKGMTCSACVASIEACLSNKNGILHSEIALLSETGYITLDTHLISLNQVIDIIEDAGFDAELIATQPISKKITPLAPLSSLHSHSKSSLESTFIHPSSFASLEEHPSPSALTYSLIQLDIHGMVHPDCKQRIETHLKKYIPDLQPHQLHLDFNSKRFTLQLDLHSPFGIRDLIHWIQQLGKLFIGNVRFYVLLTLPSPMPSWPWSYPCYRPRFNLISLG